MSQERHLSEAQISAYLSAGPDVSSETDSGTESHLKECESCRDRTLEMHRDQMGFQKAGRMTRDCPEDEILQLVAAGGSEPTIAATTMDHAARCSHCGARLKKLANIFSGDLSPEQQNVLGQLETSNPAWQREFIRDYVKPRGSSVKSASSGSDKTGLWAQIFGTWWGRAAMAGATAAIVLAAVFEGPVLSAKYDLYHAQKLVASAYGERRTTETRFSGAPSSSYNPYPVVLGPDDDRGLDVNRPELMKAEGTVADKVKGQDPRWLQLQGRISLLEATPKSIAEAQKYFEEAQRKGLNTPSLKIDLASSYYEHDVRADYPNLQRSLDLLLEVLHQPNLSNEDKAAALFDLGIAYEKTQAWDLAASTWEDYLKVDSSGAWAEQARDRLKKAKEKIPAPKPQGYNQPIFFLEHLSQLKPEDPEEYQAIALSQWLPAALEHNDAQAREAVSKLAEVLATQHSDPWLKDFSSALKPQDLPALQLLNLGVQSNADGHYNNAGPQALAAEKIFVQHGNVAGGLRAELEEVYSQRRILQGADCISRANPFSEKLKLTSYYWLRAKASLEHAECDNLRGDFTESDKNFAVSRDIAEEFDFPELVLQDIGIFASMKRLRGMPDESWRDSVEGLELYWRGAYPRGERLYQFYAVIWQDAKDTQALYAAEALLKHALSVREDVATGTSKNPLIEAISHLQHLHLAETLRIPDAYSRASDQAKIGWLFDHPKEAEKFRLIIEIEPAELAVTRGNGALALSTLAPISKIVATNQNSFFSFSFYRVQGDAYLQVGQLSSAEMSYRSAIGIAEASLGGIKNGTERLLWVRATDEVYRDLVRVLLALGKNTEALTTWEWYKSRSLTRTLAAGGLSLSSVSDTQSFDENKIESRIRLASARGVRLIFANFKDGTQIWIANRQGIRSTWVTAPAAEVEREIQTFAENCATPDSRLDELVQQGKDIYSLLLKPIEPQLDAAKTIVVELDRSSYRLPIEALTVPNGHFFGEEFAIVYSPGFFLEERLRPPTESSGDQRTLLLDASHAFHNEYLPGLESQRRTLPQLFTRTIAVNSELAALPELRRRLSTTEMFVYLGHGKPDGSGTDLMLSATESLTAEDFDPASLQHMRLSVLSACSTARGQRDGLMDTQNLVHSFLVGGVPSVIASRWNVDSVSTSRLMTSFYKQLREHKMPADAIQRARIEILNAQPHPYYWASFNLSGRAE